MIKSRLPIFVTLLALTGAPAYAATGSVTPPAAISAEAPKSKPTLVNRITKKDRLKMAVAYMKANTYMSVKQYAKITGLKKEIAQAELNVFAQDSKNPIKSVPGKKNLYYLK